MIGDAYKSKAVQAVLGPGRSDLIPAVMWGSWLDGSGALLAMTGMAVAHEAFGATSTGVANIAVIDGGACPAATPARFALMDAASSGAVIAWAPVTFSEAPAEGDPLLFAPGELVFDYTEV